MYRRGPVSFARPENALKRAEELENVGQKGSALQALHDIVTSKKHRTWSKTHEAIMLKHLDLVVEMKKRNYAKEALMQYRNMCQAVNINSLEEVIKYFLKKTSDKAEEAQSKAAVRIYVTRVLFMSGCIAWGMEGLPLIWSNLTQQAQPPPAMAMGLLAKAKHAAMSSKRDRRHAAFYCDCSRGGVLLRCMSCRLSHTYTQITPTCLFPILQAATLDVEDLEQDASPEDIMLSYVSGDKSKVRA